MTIGKDETKDASTDKALDAVAIGLGALGPLITLVQQAIADGAKTDAEALHIAMQRLIDDGHVQRTLPAVQASIAEAMKRVTAGS